MRRIICLVLISISAFMARAVDFVPVLSNFSSRDYDAGLQNWAIAEDNDGTMYFGNEEGLLTYDGARWRKVTLPGNITVRALLFARNRLFVGGYSTFGYMERDAFGNLKYVSLWNKLKHYTPHNDEIWNIMETPDHRIIFQSFCSWFEYDGKNVMAHYDPKHLPLYFLPANGHIYVQLVNGGFGFLHQKKYKQLLPQSAFEGSSVVAAIPLDNSRLLLITEFAGLFLYNGHSITPFLTAVDREIKAAQVNRAIYVPTSRIIVIGTIHNGIFAITTDGGLAWHYSMQNKLANNTVLRLFNDKNNNIWVALDAGIAMVYSGMSYDLMTNDDKPFGMVNDVYSFGNALYIATNQGAWLYDKTTAKIIDGTEGQNWHISKFGNQLMVGNNRGTKIISGTGAVLLPGSSPASSTAIRRYIISDTQDYLLESSYSDMRVYRNVNGQWKFQNNLSFFQAPIQQFEVDSDGTLWAGHMSRGVYRLELSSDMSRVVKIHYYPALQKGLSGEFVHVVKIRGQIVFATGKALYRFVKNKFVRFRQLENVFPDNLVSVTTVDNHRFWVSTNRGYSLVNYDQGKYRQMVYIPASFFGLDCSDKTNNVKVFGDKAYFCLNGGIGRMDMSDWNHSSVQHSVLSLAEVYSLDENGIKKQLNLSEGVLEGKSDIILQYSFPNFSHVPLKYVHYVEGGYLTRTLERHTPELTLSGLGYGRYAVTTIVRDASNRTLASVRYTFLVKRPFLWSIPMLVLYVFLIVLLLFLLLKWRTKVAIKAQKKEMEAQKILQDLQLAEQQRIIEAQKQELLEQQVQEQGRDILSLTMNAVKSKKGQKDDEYWKLFQENFDLIHKRFFRHLREKYPTLTANDLRFCALLRLNLSTKDIAHFTGLTIRGVEGARYRLRKKMKLSENQNISEYLIDFK